MTMIRKSLWVALSVAALAGCNSTSDPSAPNSPAGQTSRNNTTIDKSKVLDNETANKLERTDPAYKGDPKLQAAEQKEELHGEIQQGVVKPGQVKGDQDKSAESKGGESESKSP